MQKNAKELRIREEQKHREKLEKHKSDKRGFIRTERVFKIFNREREREQ